MTDEATPPPTSVVPVDLRDWVQFRDEAATQIRVFGTARIGIDLWCIQPQQSTGVLHDPDADLAYTVVGGRSWFVTDDGEVGLDPLGALLVPAGVVHGIDNRGVDPLIVMVAMSPPGDRAVDDPFAGDGLAVRPPDGAGAGRRLRDRIRGIVTPPAGAEE